MLLGCADDVSYGVRPDTAKYGEAKWKNIFANEVRGQISDADWQRVDFFKKRLSANANAFAQANYDLRPLWWPKQLAWVEKLKTT